MGAKRGIELLGCQGKESSLIVYAGLLIRAEEQ